MAHPTSRLAALLFLVVSSGCAVTRPFELLKRTRAQPERYFGHLTPGITDSQVLENPPFATPYSPRSASGDLPEYNSGRHPSLTFATYADGQYCFEYPTLQAMPAKAEAAAAAFNAQYSLVIRTHRSLDELSASDEWPQEPPKHTSKLVEQPHFLQNNRAAQSSTPEHLLLICQEGPKMDASTAFLSVQLVSNRNWRNNSLLVWDFEGKKK